MSGRVIKRSTLLLIKRPSVHLDRVEGLGDSMELEVVLRDGKSADDGLAVAHGLLRALRVDAAELVSGA